MASATLRCQRSPEPKSPMTKMRRRSLPDRGAIDTGRYLESWRKARGKTSVSLITARGCPYRCRWCSHSVYGFSHRAVIAQVSGAALQGVCRRGGGKLLRGVSRNFEVFDPLEFLAEITQHIPDPGMQMLPGQLDAQLIATSEQLARHPDQEQANRLRFLAL